MIFVVDSPCNALPLVSASKPINRNRFGMLLWDPPFHLIPFATHRRRKHLGISATFMGKTSFSFVLVCAAKNKRNWQALHRGTSRPPMANWNLAFLADTGTCAIWVRADALLCLFLTYSSPPFLPLCPPSLASPSLPSLFGDLFYNVHVSLSFIYYMLCLPFFGGHFAKSLLQFLLAKKKSLYDDKKPSVSLCGSHGWSPRGVTQGTVGNVENLYLFSATLGLAFLLYSYSVNFLNGHTLV